MGLEYDEDFLLTHPAEVWKHNNRMRIVFFIYPVGDPVQMKESHNSMDHLLSAVIYQKHKRLIYGDLKVGWLGLIAYRLFNVKSIFMQIVSSISNNSL